MQLTSKEAPSPILVITGWSLILNKIKVEHHLPYEISPGIRLALASSEQRDKMKAKLDSLMGDDNLNWTSFYECAYEQDKDNPNNIEFHQLPTEQWRYYIIETDDNGKMNIDLQRASNASLMPLDINSIRILNNGGHAWNPMALQNHFFVDEAKQPKVIGKKELCDLVEAYSQYIKVTGGLGGNSEFPEIQRALELLDSLRVIPTYSDFHVLGLFAIIEMLITHNPKLEDRGDSITHQMYSKIPLLSKRFPHKISAEDFFGPVPDKKLWSALYKYRSALAHGGKADFKDKELQILRNANIAKSFLLDVVRKMIRHAFSEPDLYRDLRAC